LVTESERSQRADTLSSTTTTSSAFIREQRDLERLIQAALARLAPADIVLYQTVIPRNKCYLLAHHTHRLDRVKDLYWFVGGALPPLLSAPTTTTASVSANAMGDLRSRFSPHMVNFLRAYNDSLIDFR
ncbi:hypothetical protein PHLGIDRAFT_49870, partial [Phlebiopsis gigantea 11061_1 CR5-6]